MSMADTDATTAQETIKGVVDIINLNLLDRSLRCKIPSHKMVHIAPMFELGWVAPVLPVCWT